MADLIYLYGFLPAGSEVAVGDLRGVDERPVEIVPLGPFDAAVSRVPAEEFDAGRVEQRLKDLEWVARQGGAHERVVTWFVDRASILPARLLTLYSSHASLQGSAREREDEIRDTLERFRNLFEWDVKVSYDRALLTARLGELAPEIEALDARIAEAPPGKRYLLQRARQEKVDDEAEGAARTLAEELLREVADIAERSVRVPLPREARGAPVVLNAALLVEKRKGKDLEERLTRRSEELAERGVEVAFSGPWAPYRFLEGEEGQEAGRG